MLAPKIGPSADGVSRKCAISECGAYRYWLRQSWGHAPEGYPTLTFVMMNPSTADGTQDDATLRAIRRMARAKGFLSLTVLNAMAFRATNPADLLHAEDPQGPHNAKWIRASLAATVGPIVCAWGQIHKKLKRHEMDLVSRLSVAVFAERLVALHIAKDGRPYHPLYQSPGTPFVPVRLVTERTTGSIGLYRLIPNEKEPETLSQC